MAVDTLYLKVPKNFEKLNNSFQVEEGAPKYIGIGYEHRNAYAFYLWVKGISRFGNIPKSALPKRKYHHWINKVIAAGFMKDSGSYYKLVGYQKVWKMLKIEKVKIKAKGRRYHFRKLNIEANSWPEFKREVLNNIFGYHVDRKKFQIRKRLKQAGVRKPHLHSSPFSALSVARLLGYRSPQSGSKYRDKYFDVVLEPLKRTLRVGGHHKEPTPMYECKKIYLKNIYH